MRNNIKIAAMAGAVILTMTAVGLTGCGEAKVINPGTIASKADGKEESKVSGNLTLNGSTSMAEVCQALGERFVEKYPQVKMDKSGSGSGEAASPVNNGSVENIKNNTYKSFRPFIDISRKNTEDELVKAWFDFIYSDEGAQVIKECKLIPTDMIMPLVYIADDEMNIRKLVSIGLKGEGIDVETFEDGESVLNGIEREKPDLVLLDIMMPKMDGIQVCARIRNQAGIKEMPVIMLTAKSTEIDKIVGLEIGADDYITKPFSIKELAARIRALLRRSRMSGSDESEKMEVNGIYIDVPGHIVKKNGSKVDLTAKEFSLLLTLIENSGNVLSRDRLLDLVWGTEYFGDTRTVDVHIRYLRQKIEDDPDDPRRIITVRGYGYKFNTGEI